MATSRAVIRSIVARADPGRAAPSRARLQAELSRAWSGFTNFAISFTIISVLAGTFTAFLFAWQNGGPIAASIGWPVLCAFVLMVAFSMAELTSKYPTAGGPTGGRTTSAARAGAG